ncbi:MAG TPA: hypothetical protein VMU94_24575 [Streptosporangiaceae bacterium]|nr:hypothetical protein [Streptosporangiaceae bacterium]
MNYDTLLQWVSERGSGSLTSFRQAYDWLTPAGADTDHWTWALQSLQALGHIEVDWDRRRWEVAPSTVATIVGGGGYALLCGARPRWFLRRLGSLATDPDLEHLADSIVLERPVPQDHGPCLRLMTLDEGAEAAEVCAALGVAYSPFAADQLLRLLPSLTDMLRAGRREETSLPGGVFPTRMGLGEPGRPVFAEIPDQDCTVPGAYCMALFDTRRYFYLHRPGDVFEAGRGEVVYAELRRRGRHVLRWDSGDGSLLVPSRFRLPQLYERAAVLRTGLLPGAETIAMPPGPALFLRYRNIDRAFAEYLGRQLGQQLAEPPAEMEADNDSRA